MCIKTADEMQVVVFKLGTDEYCVPVFQAREIQTYSTPTRIPNTPSFVEGIINLRGQIIPILDLKKRFSSGITEVNSNTRIIIIDMDEEVIGILVDSVSEVLKIIQSKVLYKSTFEGLAFAIIILSSAYLFTKSIKFCVRKPLSYSDKITISMS